MYEMTNNHNGLSRANMEMKSNVGLVLLLKAYLHIIREGISFENLSRVPTCNIQGVGKITTCPIYQFKIAFHFFSNIIQCMHLES